MLEVDRNNRVVGKHLVNAIDSSDEGARLSEEDAEHLMNMLVVDGEGDVCLYEFYRFMGRELDEDEEEEADEEVAEFAQEGDRKFMDDQQQPNSISPTLGERFKAAMAKANNSQTDLTSILAKCDYEGDGKVSIDDLRATMLNSGMFTSFSDEELQSILGMFDANDDGTVSLSEWYAAAGQTYDEAKASTSVFQRLLSVELELLNDVIRPLLSDNPDSGTFSKAEFESILSSLDTLNNVPLKLVHTIASNLSTDSFDNDAINIADIYKLFKHEFGPSAFAEAGNLSLSVSTAELSDLQSSPEFSKKKKRKAKGASPKSAKTPSPRKPSSPKGSATKLSPAKSPAKSLSKSPSKSPSLSPSKSLSKSPSRLSPSPTKAKQKSPKRVSPVVAPPSPKPEPDYSDNEDDYSDENFDDEEVAAKMEGSFENTDDVFLNHSFVMEGSYGKEDFEEEEEEELKKLSPEVKDYGLAAAATATALKDEEEEEGYR